ncbi:YcjF family protein [Frigidibacter sp. ROC022]|uniref:YcjF family protein n=1 Tax=Frigidibacter sp. ROC022 TaxID=2971796 RepID=UPI00215AE417|nr:YcjF family protein [Frigidibacter sp. ROC022]MCR8725115.1 YcjF family protein [Frigidibacter sp. ROC022]
MAERKGPVVIDIDPEDDAAPVTPATAPPVPEVEGPEGQAAMQRLAALAGRRPSVLGRWFWRLASAIVGFAVSLWAWNFVTGLLASHPVLGGIAALLIGAFVLVCLALALREWAAFARLGRLDRVHRAADAAVGSGDLRAARAVAAQVSALYAGREDLAWARDRIRTRGDEVLDADGLLGMVETELLAPLDQTARAEVEAAARQLAVVTAVVPLALADVVTALVSNLRMIRRIAEIYGGRAGTFGSWRLVRTVFAHLVATGAVAVGDDLIQSVAGGGLVSKLSRRFGEGVVNAALTARVGIAAIEVCRPMPFRMARKPTTSGMTQRALTGLFGRS